MNARSAVDNNFRETLSKQIAEFFFSPTADRWLSILRVGLGLQVLLYCWSLRDDWSLVFASNGEGMIDRDLTEAVLSAETWFAPRVGWFVTLGRSVGLSEQQVLLGFWILLVSASCCLVLGIFSRETAVTAWLLHLAAVKSGGLSSYGMDNFTTIGLFYLMVAPLPDRISLDVRLRKLTIKNFELHGFYRRVLQIHVCIIYFFGGLSKCLGAGWWNGDNLWRALIRPPFNFVPTEILTSGIWTLPAAGILVCVLEVAYPIFIWPKSTRLPWLGAVIIMHIVIGLTMGLYLFGLIMIVLNLSAFGADWFGIRRKHIAA
jgi:vitamin K-dependent gamma-carboxylase-like protein